MLTGGRPQRLSSHPGTAGRSHPRPLQEEVACLISGMACSRGHGPILSTSCSQFTHSVQRVLFLTFPALLVDILLMLLLLLEQAGSTGIAPHGSADCQEQKRQSNRLRLQFRWKRRLRSCTTTNSIDKLHLFAQLIPEQAFCSLETLAGTQSN